MLRDQPFMRDDTFLGVCESLGEAFHIPSNLLRLAMAPVLVWNPLLTAAIYVGMGVLIAIIHFILPTPASARTSHDAEPEAAVVRVQQPVMTENLAPELAKAA